MSGKSSALKDKRPDISIVIVSYEVRDLLAACLRSIESSEDGPSTEVCVVDNASTDGTPELVRNQFPEVSLVVNARNIGFAAANNVGLRRTGGECVMLLNPDTRLQPDTLKALIRAAEQFPQAIIGPKLINRDGTWQRSFWKFPTLKWIVMNALGVPARWYQRQDSEESVDPCETTPVDWISGACTFSKRTTIESIGPLCEQFFMYMEDIDLCLRAHESGIPVLYYPKAEVIHYGGASSGKYLESTGTAVWDREEIRNRIVYFQRHHGSSAGLCVRAAHLVGRVTVPILLPFRRVFKRTLGET